MVRQTKRRQKRQRSRQQRNKKNRTRRGGNEINLKKLQELINKTKYSRIDLNTTHKFLHNAGYKELTRYLTSLKNAINHLEKEKNQVKKKYNQNLESRTVGDTWAKQKEQQKIIKAADEKLEILKKDRDSDELKQLIYDKKP